MCPTPPALLRLLFSPRMRRFFEAGVNAPNAVSDLVGTSLKRDSEDRERLRKRNWNDSRATQHRGRMRRLPPGQPGEPAGAPPLPRIDPLRRPPPPGQPDRQRRRGAARRGRLDPAAEPGTDLRAEP